MNTTKGFVSGVIVTLIVVWLLNIFSCNHAAPGKTVSVKSDTTTQKITGSGTSVPTVTKITPHQFDRSKPDTFFIKGREVPVYIYTPDSSKCCENYADLYATFTHQIELQDTIWLDSLHKRGYAILKDTIAANTLIGRSYDYTLYNTIITNTVVKKQGLQMLIGGGVAGTKTDPLKLAEVDLMLRGKKGGAFGLNVKKDLNSGEVMYGFKKLWLISFRKR
jgi:hypothetical protein